MLGIEPRKKHPVEITTVNTYFNILFMHACDCLVFILRAGVPRDQKRVTRSRQFGAFVPGCCKNNSGPEMQQALLTDKLSSGH